MACCAARGETGSISSDSRGLEFFSTYWKRSMTPIYDAWLHLDPAAFLKATSIFEPVPVVPGAPGDDYSKGIIQTMPVIRVQPLPATPGQSSQETSHINPILTLTSWPSVIQLDQEYSAVQDGWSLLNFKY